MRTRTAVIIAVVVTFVLTFWLFLALDALLKGYDDSHLRFLVMAAYLLVASLLGHRVNFLPW
jgi:hypothetical protein